MSFAGSRSVPIIIDSDSDVEQVSPTPNTEDSMRQLVCQDAHDGRGGHVRAAQQHKPQRAEMSGSRTTLPIFPNRRSSGSRPKSTEDDVSHVVAGALNESYTTKPTHSPAPCPGNSTLSHLSEKSLGKRRQEDREFHSPIDSPPRQKRARTIDIREEMEVMEILSTPAAVYNELIEIDDGGDDDARASLPPEWDSQIRAVTASSSATSRRTNKLKSVSDASVFKSSGSSHGHSAGSQLPPSQAYTPPPAQSFSSSQPPAPKALLVKDWIKQAGNHRPPLPPAPPPTRVQPPRGARVTNALPPPSPPVVPDHPYPTRLRTDLRAGSDVTLIPPIATLPDPPPQTLPDPLPQALPDHLSRIQQHNGVEIIGKPEPRLYFPNSCLRVGRTEEPNRRLSAIMAPIPTTFMHDSWVYKWLRSTTGLPRAPAVVTMAASRAMALIEFNTYNAKMAVFNGPIMKSQNADDKRSSINIFHCAGIAVSQDEEQRAVEVVREMALSRGVPYPKRRLTLGVGMLAPGNSRDVSPSPSNHNQSAERGFGSTNGRPSDRIIAKPLLIASPPRYPRARTDPLDEVDELDEFFLDSVSSRPSKGSVVDYDAYHDRRGKRSPSVDAATFRPSEAWLYANRDSHAASTSSSKRRRTRSPTPPVIHPRFVESPVEADRPLALTTKSKLGRDKSPDSEMEEGEIVEVIPSPPREAFQYVKVLPTAPASWKNGIPRSPSPAHRNLISIPTKPMSKKQRKRLRKQQIEEQQLEEQARRQSSPRQLQYPPVSAAPDSTNAVLATNGRSIASSSNMHHSVLRDAPPLQDDIQEPASREVWPSGKTWDATMSTANRAPFLHPLPQKPSGIIPPDPPTSAGPSSLLATAAHAIDEPSQQGQQLDLERRLSQSMPDQPSTSQMPPASLQQPKPSKKKKKNSKKQPDPTSPDFNSQWFPSQLLLDGASHLGPQAISVFAPAGQDQMDLPPPEVMMASILALAQNSPHALGLLAQSPEMLNAHYMMSQTAQSVHLGRSNDAEVTEPIISPSQNNFTESGAVRLPGQSTTSSAPVRPRTMSAPFSAESMDPIDAQPVEGYLQVQKSDVQPPLHPPKPSAPSAGRTEEQAEHERRLRERVIASMRSRRKPVQTTDTPPSPAETISAQPAPAIELAVSEDNVISSTQMVVDPPVVPTIPLLQAPELTSTAPAAQQLVVDDDMISAFISDAIKSAKEEDIDAKQKRFESYIAKTKLLMQQLTLGQTKNEKTAIMTEIRQLNQSMNEVKQEISAAMAVKAKPVKKFQWREMQPDSCVIDISDEEEEEDA